MDNNNKENQMDALNTIEVLKYVKQQDEHLSALANAMAISQRKLNDISTSYPQRIQAMQHRVDYAIRLIEWMSSTKDIPSAQAVVALHQARRMLWDAVIILDDLVNIGLGEAIAIIDELIKENDNGQ